jgi:hypothetical protein
MNPLTARTFSAKIELRQVLPSPLTFSSTRMRERIVEHLSHVDLTGLVEGHLHRTHHIGLGGEEFGVEVFAEVHRA